MTEKTKIPVSGCIVTYNSAGEIEDCIESLLSHTEGVDFHLYISDNGSSDGTPEAVKRRFPQVTVLENGENLGFGRGHNQALPLLSSRYHVCINPDIRLEEDAITRLVAYLEEHPEVGMVMPDIRNEDGSRQELPKYDPTWWYLIGGRLFPGVRDKYCRKGELDGGPVKIEFCTGCFHVIRTDLLKELGGFDDRYFLYLEDADLAREVRARADVMFHPGIRVVHLWHRESSRSLHGLKLHLSSARKYFRKWRYAGRK